MKDNKISLSNRQFSLSAHCEPNQVRFAIVLTIVNKGDGLETH